MKRFFNADFSADTRYLKLVTDITVTLAEMAGFGDTAAKDISLAVDEGVTNTIKHAYNYDQSKRVSLHFTITSSQFIIDIRHWGSAITESEIRLPDMKEYMRQYRKGGLGIILMTRIMDQVCYGSVDGTHYCRLIMNRS